MFKYVYEIEGTQGPVNQAVQGCMDIQFSTGEQFPVISAYVETLPSGLIGDEI